MWGDEPLPDFEDRVCKNCSEVIYWRWESHEDGVWMHKRSRSMRCELFAEPK